MCLRPRRSEDIDRMIIVILSVSAVIHGSLSSATMEMVYVVLSIGLRNGCPYLLVKFSYLPGPAGLLGRSADDIQYKKVYYGFIQSTLHVSVRVFEIDWVIFTMYRV